MLTKRHAQRLINALSEDEFDATLDLLELCISDVALMLKQDQTNSPQIRAVAQGLLSEFEDGGFHLLAAILDRLAHGI